MTKILKLFSITTALVTAFIATSILIYGFSGASSCPEDWKRDNYGNCSIRTSQHESGDTASGTTRVSDQVRTADEQSKVFMAAEQGDLNAQRKLGIRHLQGKESNASIKEGLHWLERAAVQGDAAAMRVLALYNLKRDAEKVAFDWFKRAADLGDPRAAYFTATMLRYSPRISAVKVQTPTG